MFSDIPSYCQFSQGPEQYPAQLKKLQKLNCKEKMLKTHLLLFVPFSMIWTVVQHTVPQKMKSPQMNPSLQPKSYMLKSFLGTGSQFRSVIEVGNS